MHHPYYACIILTMHASFLLCMHHSYYACIILIMHASFLLCMHHSYYACIILIMHASFLLCMHHCYYTCIILALSTLVMPESLTHKCRDPRYIAVCELPHFRWQPWCLQRIKFGIKLQAKCLLWQTKCGFTSLVFCSLNKCALRVTAPLLRPKKQVTHGSASAHARGHT